MKLRERKIQTETLESSLNQPHFEEEWTVLSARQVVPISELEAKAKKRYSLKLFGAFVLASFLGVLVALTSIRLRDMTSAGGENNRVLEPAASTMAGVPTSDKPATEQPNEELTLPPASEATDDSSTIVNSKPVSVSPRKHETVNADFEDTETDDNQTEKSVESKPQPRLVDQWQEDRPRRVQPRKNRNSDGAHHPRDLRDLDEIFEGSPEKP